MKHTMQDVPLTVGQIFRRAERYFAHKTISTAERGTVEVTSYGQWAQRTRKLAGALEAMGLPAGSRVATFAANTTRHLELSFAVPASGLVLHPLNVRLPGDQLAYIINHAEDEVIFADRSLLGRLLPILHTLSSVRQLVVIDDGTGPGDRDIAVTCPLPVVDYEQLIGSADPAELTVDDESLPATICYTSGTTGNPKGIINSHRTIWLHTMSLLQADTIGICERDTVLPLVPIFHASAWGLCYAAAMAGADLVLPGADLSGPAVAQLMEERRVTFATAVPTLWSRVLPELRDRDVSAVRMLCSGGSAVPARLTDLCLELTGNPLIQVWGMTETNAFAALTRIRPHLDHGGAEMTRHIASSQGIASAGVEVRIVGDDGIGELPWDGEAVGELQCRGPWVTAGYYGVDVDHTITEDGWFRTGDAAAIDPDGYIHLRDRLKDLIKSGGEWISSLELESTIQKHPSVEAAAVIGIPDDQWDERPVACVTVYEGRTVEPAELLDWLRPQVAKFWVPDQVHVLTELPLTSVGKIDKKQLRVLFVTDTPQ
jgi:fatty-acyl-CoA synthase